MLSADLLKSVFHAIQQIDPGAITQWRGGTSDKRVPGGSYPEVYRMYGQDVIQDQPARKWELTKIVVDGIDKEKTTRSFTIGDVLYFLDRLTYRNRPEEAQALAQALISGKVLHWLPLMVLATAAAQKPDNGAFDRYIELTKEQIGTLPAYRRYYVRKTCAAHTGSTICSAFLKNNPPLLARLTELWHAIDPEFHRLFDRNALPVAASVKASHSPAPQVGPLPPAGKVLFVGQSKYYSGEAQSRLADVPPRVRQAFEARGWCWHFTDLAPLRDADGLIKAYGKAFETARDEQPDLIIVDELRIDLGKPGFIEDWIAAIRQFAPKARLVSLFMDPWNQVNWQRYQRTAEQVDAVWMCMPALGAWNHPAFQQKLICAPFPLSVPLPRAERFRKPQHLYFRGAVSLYNWPRAIWLTEMKAAGIPVGLNHSSHRRDNLSPLDSYALYLSDLAAAGANLNFSIRLEGTRTFTGRCQEVVAAGGLLIQEASPDLSHYLTAGKHYLEFDTLADLKQIWAEIRTNPDWAEQIRATGQSWIRKELSDDKILNHLLSVAFRTIPT